MSNSVYRAGTENTNKKDPLISHHGQKHSGTFQTAAARS